MAVGVPGAATDQDETRAPLLERGGDCAVDTAVVSCLHDIDLPRERLERATLRLLLCIAEQQRRCGRRPDEQDDARVVGLQTLLAALRPQDADLQPPHSEGHVAFEAYDAIGAAGGIGGNAIQHRIDDVGNADPRRPRQTCEAGQSADVVGVFVGQNNALERCATGPRKRLSQHCRLRARVDEHRVSAVTQKDRIALSDVHDREDRCGGGAAETHERDDQHKRDCAEADPRGSMRRGPPDPQPDGTHADRGQSERSGCRDCHEHTRHRGDALPSAHSCAGDERGHAEQRYRTEHASRQTERDGRLDDGSGDDEHARPERRNCAEQRR